MDIPVLACANDRLLARTSTSTSRWAHELEKRNRSLPEHISREESLAERLMCYFSHSAIVMCSTKHLCQSIKITASFYCQAIEHGGLKSPQKIKHPTERSAPSHPHPRHRLRRLRPRPHDLLQAQSVSSSSASPSAQSPPIWSPAASPRVLQSARS